MKAKTLKNSEPVSNKLKAVFTNFTTEDNWVNGTCGKYTFEAKLFDVGSSYGIKNGRVSKLAISDSTVRNKKKEGSTVLEVIKSQSYEDSCIATYDRGWDKRPKTVEEKAVFKAVMKLLEESPKRFE